MKTLSLTLSKKVPTWAAYNSLYGKNTTATAVMMLPVINGSRTNWNNFYNALKEAKKLRESASSDGKTLISFDLQLYIKSLRFQGKKPL